ncbi:uncharacterized protein TRIADDRAFT_52790 [Trichoplax adhaerens]|uniref:EGF-like domain-containing protein n=1 Tax=Trichoplax adhaerens TaxID=10228 RepID=B3RKC1_TRIAD|nr:predicted protein [Trichoplax adhaerens]EDV29175.1 predicted protein [Trichoplax adhaerens]|eukprot:XP_002108377.1 predicted protein [Trichoplax adhaerens]
MANIFRCMVAMYLTMCLLATVVHGTSISIDSDQFDASSEFPGDSAVSGDNSYQALQSSILADSSGDLPYSVEISSQQLLSEDNNYITVSDEVFSIDSQSDSAPFPSLSDALMDDSSAYFPMTSAEVMSEPLQSQIGQSLDFSNNYISSNATAMLTLDSTKMFISTNSSDALQPTIYVSANISASMVSSYSKSPSSNLSVVFASSVAQSSIEGNPSSELSTTKISPSSGFLSQLSATNIPISTAITTPSSSVILTNLSLPISTAITTPSSSTNLTDLSFSISTSNQPISSQDTQISTSVKDQSSLLLSKDIASSSDSSSFYSQDMSLSSSPVAMSNMQSSTSLVEMSVSSSSKVDIPRSSFVSSNLYLKSSSIKNDLSILPSKQSSLSVSTSSSVTLDLFFSSDLSLSNNLITSTQNNTGDMITNSISNPATTNSPVTTPTPTVNPCLNNPCQPFAVCNALSTLTIGYFCTCRVGYYQQDVNALLTNSQGCLEGSYFTGTLSLDDVFEPTLNDPNNQKGQRIKNDSKTQIEAAIRNSQDAATNFLYIIITGLRSGSIIVDFYAVYDNNATVNQTAIQDTIQQNVQTVGSIVVQGVNVTETNECAVDNDPCSGQKETCIDLQDGFKCQRCPTGFQFNTSTKGCSDINECLASVSPCKANEKCINEDGKYSCTLKSTINPSQVTCTATSCLNGGNCSVDSTANEIVCIKSFYFSCTIFFTGKNCQNLSTITIILITSGAGLGSFTAILLVAVAYYRRQGKSLTKKSINDDYEEMIDGNNDLVDKEKGYINNDAEEIPLRPYAGQIGGEYTTIIYEAKHRTSMIG